MPHIKPPIEPDYDIIYDRLVEAQNRTLLQRFIHWLKNV